MPTDDDSLRRTAGSLQRQLAAGHPEAETTLVAYVDGTLDPFEREAVEEHLAGCTVCREDVGDLQQMRASLSPAGQRRSPAVRWLVAAAFGGAALLGGFLYMRQPPSPVIRHQIASRRADWEHLVRDALTSGRIEMPATLRALQMGPDVLRGSQQASVEGTFQPSGTIVEGQQPPFSWPATPGAHYAVSVALGTQEVEHSDVLHDARWTPPTPLPRGATYMWQVEVRDGAGSHVIPAPPHPALLFAVLDARIENEIAEARRAAPDDHLLLGVLYGRAGVREGAKDELSLWLAEHPGDGGARRMLDSLDRWK